MTLRGRTWPSALLAVLLLAAAHPALAKPSPQATLKQAIRLVSQLEDERAKAMLIKLLRHSPRASIAAQAHVYLGIIALNALETGLARSEFKKAIETDDTVELPLNAAPKARLLFGEAQGNMAQTAPPPEPAPAAEPAPPSVLVVPSEPAPEAAAPEAAPTPAALPAELAAPFPPKPANHLPAYIVGGVAVAALAGGIIFGVEANSTLAAAKLNPVAAAAEAQGAQVGTYGLVADICYGVSAVAGVAAVILFFMEKPETSGDAAAAPAPAASLIPIPGGAVLSAGGRF
jgi:hypothetical protein